MVVIVGFFYLFQEDAFKHEIIFWGRQNNSSLPKKSNLCGTVVEIPIKQICISETTMIILTRYQRIYTFQVRAESLVGWKYLVSFGYVSL